MTKLMSDTGTRQHIQHFTGETGDGSITSLVRTEQLPLTSFQERWTVRYRPYLEELDMEVTQWLGRYAIVLLRVAMGIVFLWFGLLKFVPGWSPAEDLALRTIGIMTFGMLPPHARLLILASWESLIGLGLLTGYRLRTTLVLLLLQMVGTITPLMFFPFETFIHFPYAPTLEGQYIIKNIVLITGALVIATTIRAVPASAKYSSLREDQPGNSL